MSDLATRLAEAVEKIGGEGHLPEFYHGPSVPRPIPDNLKAPEDWLAGKGYSQTSSRHPKAPKPWFWRWRGCHLQVIGEAEGTDENETRAEAALRAFEAIKKEES